MVRSLFCGAHVSGAKPRRQKDWASYVGISIIFETISKNLELEK